VGTTVIRTFAAFAALTLITVTAPALTEQYLCVPDKATGFAYNKNTKEWDTTEFKTSQFVIAPVKGGKPAYRVTDIGDESLPGYCDKDYNEAGILFCYVYGGDLRFNKVNGRFLRVFVHGYYTVGIPGPINETDDDSGTPMIEIGKCSAFEP
jgi:hypothetical protein